MVEALVLLLFDAAFALSPSGCFGDVEGDFLFFERRAVPGSGDALAASKALHANASSGFSA